MTDPLKMLDEATPEQMRKALRSVLNAETRMVFNANEEIYVVDRAVIWDKITAALEEG